MVYMTYPLTANEHNSPCRDLYWQTILPHPRYPRENWMTPGSWKYSDFFGVGTCIFSERYALHGFYAENEKFVTVFLYQFTIEIMVFTGLFLQSSRYRVSDTIHISLISNEFLSLAGSPLMEVIAQYRISCRPPICSEKESLSIKLKSNNHVITG